MNKITRKSFLKVLAATMVGGAAASALTGAAAPVSIDETNGKVSRWVKNNLNPDGPLTIAKQGMFSSGGTVTAPVAGTYDATTNWLDTTRAGNTAHVDHANVLYQIPADSNGWPMVYLHGYGQSRMGWITTPDGRQGWADLFLRNGYSAFLVDQPRRGEAGSTAQMSTDGFLDTWSADSKDYKPGDQAWYTHFRIGRVAPERYEGSQFPEGDAAQNQFFRQMTPNTGDFDQAVAAAALGEVPVGAVVAKDGEIIARAHNLRESGKNATYHAELLAIDAACKALGGWRLWQCELFVTLEPCPMCSGAIINSRLKRVVYGARDPKAGCCGSLTDLFALPFNHHPVMESGLLEEEAQALLQDFFAMLREKRKKK